MERKRIFPCLCLVFAVAIVRINANPLLKTDSSEVCNTPECNDAAKDIKNNMDESINPCSDFYEFACGGWIRNNPIPSTASGSYGSFDILIEKVEAGIEAAITKPPTVQDPVAIKKLRSLYSGCIDTDSIDQVGYAPFLEEVLIDEYGTWPMIRANSPELPNFKWEGVAGLNMRYWFGPNIISSYVGQDIKQATRNIIQLDQPLLGLPALDYYLDPTTFEYYITAYKTYIVDVARAVANASGEAVSDEQLQQEADKIFQFEAKLAEVSVPPEVRQGDPETTYNLMTFGELKKRWPKIDWVEYMERVLEGIDVTVDDAREVNVNVPTFFDSLSDLISSTDQTVVANYLYWRRIEGLTSDGPAALIGAHETFQNFLTGQDVPTPRGDACITKVSGIKGLPYAVGYVYVADNFAESTKKEIELLVSDLKTAFKSLIDGNSWMDEETKIVAKGKADAMVALIGYPAEYQTPDGIDALYSTVPPIDPTLHYKNMKYMMDYAFRQLFITVDQPIDRSKWLSSPAVVNAFYAPPLNSITFPAGILGSPIVRAGAPRYLNYGAIGVVIGHEITHGFDNSGRQYDSLGNLSPWWPEAIVDAFVDRAPCYIDQYDNYFIPELVPLLGPEDAHVDGVLTQGENIADNGGLHEAITAYLQSVETQGPELPLPGLEHYSSQQMFFISYAQVWCETLKKEFLANQVLGNPHSPGKYRVWGPLSNSQEFADAFQCPEGSTMSRKEKCDLW